jgi:hypothetical protein
MSVVQLLLSQRDSNYDPGGSGSELDVLAVIREAKLPEPVQQLVVKVKGKTYRLDYAWPEYKVYCEWYGAPFHIGASAVRYDNQRVTDMSGIGWLPAIFTDGASSREIVEGVTNALRERGWDGEPR